jgi:hypothetical protein
MRKLLGAVALIALMLVSIGVTSAASKAKPTTTTAATTTTLPQPTGLHGYEVVEAQSTLVGENSGQIQATAVCPTGKVVLGGGGSPTITDERRPYIARTSPVWDGTRWVGWQVIAYLELPAPPSWGLTAFAICAFPS